MRTLTPVTLPADPTEDLHAATKQYVDDSAGTGGGRWELVVEGVAPPVPVTNEAEDDFLYAFVED